METKSEKGRKRTWRKSAFKKRGRKLRKNLKKKKPVAEGSPPGFPKKWEKIKEEKPVAEGSPEGFQKKNWKKSSCRKKPVAEGSHKGFHIMGEN